MCGSCNIIIFESKRELRIHWNVVTYKIMCILEVIINQMIGDESGLSPINSFLHRLMSLQNILKTFFFLSLILTADLLFDQR